METRLLPSSSSDTGPSPAAFAAVTALGCWAVQELSWECLGLRADQALCSPYACNELQHGLPSLAVAWLFSTGSRGAELKPDTITGA